MGFIYRGILYLTFLLLVACGFHLYNKESIPPELKTLYLQSNTPYGSFETELKQSLTANSVILVQNPKAAPYTLNIMHTELTHDEPSISSSSQATVYNYTYSVTFNLTSANNKTIMQPQTVSTTRTLTLNPNEVLDASPEVDTMQTEMQHDLVFQLMNRLNSLNTKQALMLNTKTHETNARTTTTKTKK